MTARDRPTTLTWTTGIVATVAVIWLFRAAAVMPLAAAFFIAIVIRPVQVWLHQRLRRYEWAAVPLTMALIVAILGGGIWAMAEAIDEAVERAPRYAGVFQQRWQQVVQLAEQNGLPLPQRSGLRHPTPAAGLPGSPRRPCAPPGIW